MKGSVLKIISFISLVVFFFPFFTVSCSSEKVSVSGMNLTFGKNIMGNYVGGNILMILLFILPLAVLIIVLEKLVEYESITALISGGLGFMLLIYAKISIHNQAEKNYAEVNTEMGYYLMILLNLAFMGVAAYDFFIEDKEAFLAKILPYTSKDNHVQTVLAPGKNMLYEHTNTESNNTSQGINFIGKSPQLKNDFANKAPKPAKIESIQNPIRQIDVECPLIILRSELIKVYSDENLIEAKIEVDMKNKTKKVVQAIEFRIRALNYFDEELENLSFSYTVSQIAFDKKEKAEINIPVSAEYVEQIGISEIIISRLRYINGEQWKTQNNRVTITLEDEDIKLYQHYFGIDAICYPEQDEKNWKCICGTQNNNDNELCRLCGRDLKDIKISKEGIKEKLIIEIPTELSIEEIKKLIIENKRMLRDDVYEEIIKMIENRLEVIRLWGYREESDQIVKNKIMSLIKEQNK